MSPLRQKAFDEIAMLPECQLMFVVNMLDGLKKIFEQQVTASKDPFYTPDNQKFVEEGIQALSSGKGVEHELIEV